ncbi:Di-trans-poly-cis-decaprenylcistransferase-like protein [Cordyceps militaris CM01]|uniref:Alkyl transferase n=1 Tax=Cordyceps militaris (strain CM01) TaxID=983644 RepID=G3J5B5_CORMM|nr:Di-trans-poly-cis-decaprenylcistransferase-like protein [Cordyceps militaris CM01]EGX96825.1 Di-trans-poly-cis-decaprenylcistransferase-like protein [Cordyceps militaris CM01]
MKSSSSSPNNQPAPRGRSRLDQRLLSLAVATARRGPVPRHIAFILDGNRRWGRRRGRSLRQAYLKGWQQYVEFCSRCGVEAISVYAFSVENFKRSADEVSTVLEIVMESLDELVQQMRDLDGSIRLCGQRDLVSAAVLEGLDQAVESTKQNKSIILNICFAYASTAEIQMAVQRSIQERLTEQAAAGDATHSLSSAPINMVAALDRNMYTAGSPPLDLLVRTGNTHRLSDFLLWQCHEDTSIVFVKKSWPELSIPRVLAILIEWRRGKSVEKDKKGALD